MKKKDKKYPTMLFLLFFFASVALIYATNRIHWQMCWECSGCINWIQYGARKQMDEFSLTTIEFNRFSHRQWCPGLNGGEAVGEGGRGHY